MRTLGIRFATLLGYVLLSTLAGAATGKALAVLGQWYIEQ